MLVPSSIPGPDERDLGGRAEMKVERAEIAAEARRVASHEVGHRPKDLERERLEPLLAVVEGETEQPVRNRGGAGRDGVIVQVPRSHHQRFLIEARVEEHLALSVPEQSDRLLPETP